MTDDPKTLSVCVLEDLAIKTHLICAQEAVTHTSLLHHIHRYIKLQGLDRGVRPASVVKGIESI